MRFSVVFATKFKYFQTTAVLFVRFDVIKTSKEEEERKKYVRMTCDFDTLSVHSAHFFDSFFSFVLASNGWYIVMIFVDIASEPI